MNISETNTTNNICFEVPTDKPGKKMQFSFEHSNHSFVRSRQTSLNDEKISVALKYGKSYYKQGRLFYVLGEKDIPSYLMKKQNKLANTIVVVSGDSNRIITCYRSKSPYKHIKKKTDRLSKYRYSA